MNTVTVNASAKYSVLIGENLIADAGELTKNALPAAKKLAIVCDSNVAPLYAGTVEKSLAHSGFETCMFVFPAGEESKCSKTYVELLEFLAKERLSRKDAIIALGGGVTGDLSGFAAATYLRGIDFIQIPTTLLAAVDSSVGGKTGIDLDAGKNLAGAFHQPKLVICDTATLKSLTEGDFACGMAEVIKYGVIRDPELFSLLEKSADKLTTVPGGAPSTDVMELLENVIATCVGIKRDVVEADEFEGGLRQILNYGHTAAHSIEKLSGYLIPHGAAVAAGMVIAADFACKKGLCSKDSEKRISALLPLCGLPDSVEKAAEMYGVSADALAPEPMANAALSDKKCSSGGINLVLPTGIGDCVIERVPTSRLSEFFGI